jgi:hypothetical protein
MLMHARLRRSAVALLASTLAAGALAAAPAADAAVDGTITGTVTAPGGAPLAGVQVAIFTYDAPYDEWSFEDDVVTNASGAYSITAPSGTYRIGFAGDVDVYAPEYYVDAPSVDTAQNVVLADGGSVVANAELAPASSISGVVTGPDGQPAAGVDILVMRAGVAGSNGFPFFEGYAPVGGVNEETDSTGAYSITGLPAGSYRIGFVSVPSTPSSSLPPVEWYEDQPSVYSAKDVTVAAGQALGGINASLAPEAVLEGTVTDKVGQGVPGVLVTVLAKAGQEWKTASIALTGTDGIYAATVKSNATYRVRFDLFRPPMGLPLGTTSTTEYWQDKGLVANATSIPVVPGQVVTGIDAQMVPGEHAAERKQAVQNTAIPTITGSPVVGATLTANPGTYAPAPSALAFQWTRDNQPIAGAIGATYVPTAADLGTSLAVVVTASAEDRDAAMARSAGTAPVAAPAAAPVDVKAELAQILKGAKVAGKPKVGATVKLKGLDASFRAAAGTKIAYKVQWFAGSKKIKKATKTKLTITKAMRGKKISVKVTATAAGTKVSRKLILGKAR